MFQLHIVHLDLCADAVVQMPSILAAFMSTNGVAPAPPPVQQAPPSENTQESAAAAAGVTPVEEVRLRAPCGFLEIKNACVSVSERVVFLFVCLRVCA